jgi:hypothetical protein
MGGFNNWSLGQTLSFFFGLYQQYLKLQPQYLVPSRVGRSHPLRLAVTSCLLRPGNTLLGHTRRHAAPKPPS